MKILRLKITDKKGFRSLHAGFEHQFQKDWSIIASRGVPVSNTGELLEKEEVCEPFILSGSNGSGKSNILEALSEMFFQLEKYRVRRSFLPDFYLEKEAEREDFTHRLDAFELDYLTFIDGNDHLIKIRKKPTKKGNDGLNIEGLKITKTGFYSDVNEIPLTEQKDLDLYLPEYILGYSSGENEILSLPFFKMRFIQYDEYWRALNKEYPYSGRPETRMAYLDSSFSQAILITNLLIYGEDSPELQIYKELLEIESFQSFRIILKETIQLDEDTTIKLFGENYGEHPAFYSEEYSMNGGGNKFNLLKLLSSEEGEGRKIIDRLKNCATCFFYEESTQTWYLDYWVNEATTEAFRENFGYHQLEAKQIVRGAEGNPLELFQAFQVLLTLNLYTVSEELKEDLYASNSIYVNETVPTLASDERIMRFKHVYFQKKGVEETVMVKSLSDGEHQLLHSLGLCLLFKNTNSLFLFDEPETHFNPKWRSDFIANLNKVFKGSYGEREMLITTHSPFLISDSKPEKVLVFEKKKGEVSVSNPDYNTFGASINQITMKTFGEEDTIGAIAQRELKEFLERYEKGEDVEELIKAISYKMGDSIEKSMIISEMLESGKG